ncbi:MAG: phosphoribosylaminoimidazole carboxylase catalytic subunit [uncultured bacterium]|nr:MAG: phosphoribosylaminoimidazole carboxylase catalytic subunit [uncultured bacterium]
MGSMSDWRMGNLFLALMKKFGIRVHPSVASCHWSAGNDFTVFIAGIEEDLIAIMGGLSLAAPGIAGSTIQNLEEFGKLVFGIPLDEAALSAIQDLPPGVPILTCGFNKKDVTISITNAALAVARIIGRDDPAVQQKIADYYRVKREEKGIVEKIELDQNGLIPDPSPKRVLS